jgi:hypothetical protein
MQVFIRDLIEFILTSDNLEDNEIEYIVKNLKNLAQSFEKKFNKQFEITI